MLPFRKISREQLETYFLFFVLVAVGIFMRFYSLNWDSGYMFHPDERNIANAVTKIHFFSQLNPQFFAYGGFSIYLYRAAGDLLVGITNNPSWVSDWGEINLIGRFFSAVFSSLSIIPLFFLTKKLFKTIPAIFATLIWAFTVSSIQLAHFSTTESLLTLEALSLVYLALLCFEKLTFKKSILAGILFGISLATKTSAILFILPVMIAFVFSAFKNKTFLKPFIAFIAFSIVSCGIFFLFSPYTFLDSKDFLDSMHYESGVATGSLIVPYTLQFNGTIPYLFQVQQFFWQLGLLTPFGVVGFLWLLWTVFPTNAIVNLVKHSQNVRLSRQSFHSLYSMITTKHFENLCIFLIFPLIYFLYVGSWHTKFIRYMLPILPFFVICGTYLLLQLYHRYQRLGTILLMVILSTTLLWSLAFFSIYTAPQTRIAASEWVYSHIPAGSKVYTEHWDDGLPISINNFSSSQYQSEPLTIYDPDGPLKLMYYGTKLSQGDYIIINSRRLYGTLIRLTKEYPLTSTYYKDLFAGKLGYQIVAEFSSYPHLGPLVINDDTSEETFQVYDHPKVIVFKNTGHLSAERIEAILSHS